MTINQAIPTPRIRQTRQMLHHALLDLMQEKQFSQITINDITTRAALNRTTFYDHYADKYALLEDTVHESFQRTLRHKIGTMELTTETLQCLGMETYMYLSQFRKGPGESVCHEDASQVAHLHLGLRTVIERWLTSGKTPRSLSKAEVGVISWAIFGLATELVQRKGMSMQEIETEIRNVARMFTSQLAEVTR